MDSEENTIVISDLLTFVSNKINEVPKKRLFTIIKEFYPKDEISQAYATLFECIPRTVYQNFAKSVKSDTISKIFEMIANVPRDSIPIFVCQNMNNIPQIRSKTTPISISGSNISQKQQQELQVDHNKLQSNIDEVSNTLCNLKEQLEVLKHKYKSFNKQTTYIPERVNSDISPEKLIAEDISEEEDEIIEADSSEDSEILNEIEDKEKATIHVSSQPVEKIKKEPEYDINEYGRPARKRQKFSHFSEDFVLEIGGKSRKK